MHLVILCKLLQDSPSLFTSPRKSLHIFRILTESSLLQLVYAARYDVFHSILHALATAHFVKQLTYSGIRIADLIRRMVIKFTV